MATPAYHYPGGELELFANAKNWKAYWSSHVRPWLRGRVIEVGGGIGANIDYLLNPEIVELVSLEPDGALFRELQRRTAVHSASTKLSSMQGTLSDVPATGEWDAVVYIDVLEHIEDDRGELARAAERLRPGGVIVVLSPAHQRVYSKFDAAIGHVRRYDRSMMPPLTPAGCELVSMKYLDAAGLLASAANRFLLRQDTPQLRQILTWDRRLVPVSRRVDPLFGYRVGKTILAVWRRLP